MESITVDQAAHQPVNRAERRAAAKARPPKVQQPKRPRGRPRLVKPIVEGMPDHDLIPPQNLSTGFSVNGSADKYPNEFGPTPHESWDQADARIGDFLKSRVEDTPPTDFPVRETARRGRRSADSELMEGIERYYNTAALLLMPLNNADGMAFAESAHAAAEAHIAVSRHHKSYRRFLERIVRGNDYTTLILIHAGLLGSVARNHNVKLPTLKSLVTPRQSQQKAVPPVPPVQPMGNAGTVGTAGYTQEQLQQMAELAYQQALAAQQSQATETAPELQNPAVLQNLNRRV